ncbi:MAG: helix-hairpin-helix domain-containing protein [Geobacter sp.]|nr:helix-hairpin-helix domain-containing protein [Geobacter sp.]
MERGERLALWFVAAIALLLLLTKGHTSPRKEEGVAFLHGASGGVLVRLAGDLPEQGVYRFADGVTVRNVINMTLPDQASSSFENALLATSLVNGDILEVRGEKPHNAEFAVKKMGAGERIAYGILLEPDKLDANDWEALPGIGPNLAERIVADRQKYGDFGGLHGVSRVPGIGEGKLKLLEKHFVQTR